MFNLPIFTAFNGLLFYRWVSLARGDHSCDQCGKSFINGAHLKNHIKQDHEVRYTTSSPYFFTRCLNLVPKLNIELFSSNSGWKGQLTGAKRKGEVTGARSCLPQSGGKKNYWWSMPRTSKYISNTNTNTMFKLWIQIQIQVKKEVVAIALATSNREAAIKYKIEESTIRAWVKKAKNGTIDSSVARKQAYFQQKYSEQVSVFL